MCRSRRSSTGDFRRGAVTLIELIVLGLICAFCLAVTIPWLQSAREVSRKNQAMANMKHLGTAFQAYHGTWQRYPGR